MLFLVGLLEFFYSHEAVAFYIAAFENHAVGSLTDSAQNLVFLHALYNNKIISNKS